MCVYDWFLPLHWSSSNWFNFFVICCWFCCQGLRCWTAIGWFYWSSYDICDSCIPSLLGVFSFFIFFSVYYVGDFSPREREHLLYLCYCGFICNICIFFMWAVFIITFCMPNDLFCNGIPLDAKGTGPLLLRFDMLYESIVVMPSCWT